MCGLTHATSFEVTQVIEVDSEVGGPIKWSPDGLKLSYFKGKQLYISDTLGNSTFIKELELFPHRYEWLDNNKLVLHIKKHEGPKSTNKLITVDINTQQDSLITSYIYQAGISSKVAGFESFRGPHKSLEGNIYYENNTNSGNKSIPSQVNRSFFGLDKELKLSTDSKINWKRKGEIYRVNCDNSDSVLIADKPWWTATPFELSKEDTLVLSAEYLINLSTQETIDIGDITGPPPPNTLGCGILYYSFNPLYPEMIFNQGCDIDEGTTLNRVIIYNYFTNELQIIDSIANLTNCTTPVFHPSGNIISLRSSGKLYLIYRTGMVQ